MLLTVIVSGVCVWIRATTFNSLSDRIAKRLRYDLFYFLINKDVEFFDENKTGDILSRMSSDVGVIQDGLSTNVSMAFRSIITIICVLILLCLISWKLTLVTIGGIIPVVGFAMFNGRL
jgi:ABC-type bacteriocin/lantibiotic exporter with double-glycine peptidase domain